jgi:hypothetical protein
MKTTLKLHRALTAILITGISILVLAPAHAADAPEVTAFNYVRAESVASSTTAASLTTSITRSRFEAIGTRSIRLACLT